MLTSPQEYLDTLTGPGREWLAGFLGHMAENHPDIAPVMFRQRPMFKVGKSYVLFSVAKTHFTVHTLNFDLIESLKPRLPKAAFGRGSVQVKFADVAAKPVLTELCDEIVRLNQLPNAPEVDVVPAPPYGVKLANAFSGGKAKWLPLYETLRNAAREQLPPFTEYFPAVNVLWKHTSTFAQVSAVSGALRVEFYADSLHPERMPVKTVQTSKNRVAHTVELADASRLQEVLGWVQESYALTKGKS